MPPHSPPAQRLRKLFRRHTAWMLAELAHALGCALITVRRCLKDIGYCRSYTHNGKWYTHAQAPQFSREGLWHYQGIGFSKYGSLTATIRELVGRSPAGLSARELAQKLQHPCHAVLTHLHKDGALDRLKLEGQFRYLATDASINRRQRQQAVTGQQPAAATSLSTPAAVLVLVEHIKNPGLSFEQTAARLQQQQGLSVTPEAIGHFFQEHGLKKTPETSRGRS